MALSGSGKRVDIVRASLPAADKIDHAGAVLDASLYDEGYRLAREKNGAWIPEYLDSTAVTDN